jgi:hypothetical protein
MRWVAFAAGLVTLGFSSGGVAQERSEPRVDQIVREYPFPEREPAAGAVPTEIDLEALQESAGSLDTPPVAERLCPCPDTEPDGVEVEVAFDTLVWRFAFFRQWLAAIETAAFEAAAARYAKLLAMTRQLESEHAQELERRFEEEVSLYLLRRAFMDRIRQRETTSTGE